MAKSPGKSRSLLGRVIRSPGAYVSVARYRLERLSQMYLARLFPVSSTKVRVCYAHPGFPRQPPSSKQYAHGGIVKFQRLAQYLPHAPYRYNILYLVSSKLPADVGRIFRQARQRGAKIAWNQNGVFYPAWYSAGWKEVNAKMVEPFRKADYVFYQSKFARSSTSHFLGEPNCPSEVLYNAVDTALFSPALNMRPLDELILLLVGSQYHFYPLESAIRVLALVVKSQSRARLFIAGQIWKHRREPLHRLITELGLREQITFLPPFTQKEAPDLYRRCDILFHTKIQDVCPGVVIEAMACGLPVVYSMSGGVPELVGEEAGVGVLTEVSWERRTPPPPELWADAVLTVAGARSRYAEAARQRAVERFDIKPWVQRHREVFRALLDQG